MNPLVMLAKFSVLLRGAEVSSILKFFTFWSAYQYSLVVGVLFITMQVMEEDVEEEGLFMEEDVEEEEEEE